MIERRDLLVGLGALVAGACARRATPTPTPTPPPVKVDHLAHATGAARYLRRFAVKTPHGLVWRKSPDEPGVLGLDLYHGSPGVAVFLTQ